MASSSSSSSSSDSDEESSSSDVGNPPIIKNLEELPSDDSVSLLDNSSSDDDGRNNERHNNDQDIRNSDDSNDSGSSRSDSSSSNQDESDFDDDESNDDDDEDHIPLEERLARKRNAGLPQKTLEDERNRKKMALAKARDNLLAASKELIKQTAIQKTKRVVSKHAPTEVSSSRKEYFRRGAPVLNSSGIGVEINKHKYKPRDPRYSNDNNNAAAAKKRFAFLQDMIQSDIVKVKKRIAAHQATGKRGQRQRRKLKTTLQNDQLELQHLLQQQSMQIQSNVKLVAKQKVGNNYYPKRRELKRLELEAKFEEIRKRGGDKAVQKAMAKRRKKLKAKDAKYF